MEGKTVGFYFIFLFYFHKGKNATQACEKLHEVYGDDALTTRQFAKFRSGNFVVNDAPRSGRPLEADVDEIKAMVKSNPWYMTLRGTTHCSTNRS
ncbi:Histone-lysine N-methyltransferase SETMAR, partial [Stegodyphus mimosarum]